MIQLISNIILEGVSVTNYLDMRLAAYAENAIYALLEDEKPSGGNETSKSGSQVSVRRELGLSYGDLLDMSDRAGW